MATLSKEDSLKIAARLFYDDSEPGEYKDYPEALAEFMSNPPNDKFLEFVLEPCLEIADGCAIVMNDVGHVASVRISDGYFLPRTLMTETEGRTMEETFHAAAKQYPDLDGVDLLVKIGWKVI